MPFALLTPRAALMAVFTAFGALVGAIAGAAPQMMAQAGLDNSGYGLAVTALSAAAVAAMALAGAMARHLSHRALLLAMLPAALGLLLALLAAGSPPWFLFAAAAYGFASGTLDAIMNAEAGSIEHDLGRRVYTQFHGAASLSVGVFALASSLLATRYGALAAGLPAALATLLAMVLVAVAVPARPLPPKRRADRPPVFSAVLLLIGAAAGLIIACEVSALFWSSALLAGTAPSLAAIAGLGASFYGLTNAVVRFPGDRLRGRFGEVPLITASLALAILGFAGLGLTDGFAGNVFFFALTGMGLAILCPCLFAMAAQQTPENRAAGLSVAMLVAGAPRVLAPTAFGAVAEAASTRFAFGLCAMVLIVALLVIRRLAPRL